MILKAKKAADHMEFGAFISREIRLLKIDRAMISEESHMSQSYLEDIKKGSIIMRWTIMCTF